VNTSDESVAVVVGGRGNVEVEEREGRVTRLGYVWVILSTRDRTCVGFQAGDVGAPTLVRLTDARLIPVCGLKGVGNNISRPLVCHRHILTGPDDLCILSCDCCGHLRTPSVVRKRIV